MSTYEQLRGARLKFLDQDPANASNGQVWYNSATGKDRVQGIGVSAWSSGPPTNSPHGDGSGCGEQTATVIWAGYTPGPINNLTEEYNGTGWTSGGNYPATTIGAGSAGILTAALGISGRTGPSGNTNACNTYDGSSWTATTNYPASNYGTIGFGSQTSAVGVGGNPRADASPSGIINSVFDWDGSSWTSSSNFPSTAVGAGGTGSQTAGITAGAMNSSGTQLQISNSYDGSAWTANSNITRPGDTNMAQAGNQTSSLIYGGNTNDTKTESWDGTSWSSEPDLAGVGGYGGQMGATNNSSGSSKGLLAATRSGSNYPTNTEEYNFSSTTITPAAWSNGGALNTARGLSTTFGTQTAAVQAGGGPPFTGATEEYDGSSWTTSPGSLNTSRGQGLASSGVLTAGLAFGGGNPNDSNATEEYDGSTWTTTGNMNVGRRYTSGFGIQTATIAAGGFTSPPAVNRSESEEYNGSTWTAGPTINTARNGLSGTGTTSAGLIFAGSPQSTNGGLTEEWNGTAWSEQNDMNVKRSAVGRAGTQTDALVAGGNQNPPYSTATEGYDGTSWSTRPNMATARGTSGDGTSTAAIVAGGNTPTATSATEEFTGETTSPGPAQSLTTSS